MTRNNKLNDKNIQFKNRNKINKSETATINLANNAFNTRKCVVEYFKAKDSTNTGNNKRRTVGGWISLILFWALLAILFVIIVGLIIGYRPAIVLSGSMRPTIQPGDITIFKKVDIDSLKIGDVIMFTGKDAGKDPNDTVTDNITHRIENFRYKLNLTESQKTEFENAGVTVPADGIIYATALEGNEDLLNDVQITNFAVITHGDANNKGVTREQYLENFSSWSCEDPTKEVILGKVFTVLPWIGIPLLFVKNNIFIIISASIALFALWYLIVLIKNRGKDSANEQSEGQ